MIVLCLIGADHNKQYNVHPWDSLHSVLSLVNLSKQERIVVTTPLPNISMLLPATNTSAYISCFCPAISSFIEGANKLPVSAIIIIDSCLFNDNDWSNEVRNVTGHTNAATKRATSSVNPIRFSMQTEQLRLIEWQWKAFFNNYTVTINRYLHRAITTSTNQGNSNYIKPLAWHTSTSSYYITRSLVSLLITVMNSTDLKTTWPWLQLEKTFPYKQVKGILDWARQAEEWRNERSSMKLLKWCLAYQSILGYRRRQNDANLCMLTKGT